MAVVTPDNRTQHEQQIRRLFRHQRISLVTLAVIFSLAWFYLTIIPERPARALMEYGAIEVLSDTALCPGDTLVYRPTLHVNGPGVFTIDTTVFRVTPPATLVFSEAPLRAIFAGPTVFESTRRLPIPAGWRDPDTGELHAWEPGQYELRRAISTTSRSTEPSVISIPFSIRLDCETAP